MVFNKKILNMIEGKVALGEVEDDDLPPPSFAERRGIFDNVETNEIRYHINFFLLFSPAWLN